MKTLLIIILAAFMLVACDSSSSTSYDHRTPHIEQWQSVIDMGVVQ